MTSGMLSLFAIDRFGKIFLLKIQKAVELVQRDSIVVPISQPEEEKQFKL